MKMAWRRPREQPERAVAEYTSRERASGPRNASKRLEFEHATTPGIVRWRRVASTARTRRDTAFVHTGESA